MKSWKTTLAGVMAFITLAWTQVQFLVDVDPATNPDWTIVISALLVLLGFGVAKDDDADTTQPKEFPIETDEGL